MSNPELPLGPRSSERDRGAKDSSAKGARRRLLAIDAANSFYRAFFAIPPLRAPDGTATNAVLGFATMVGKLVRDEQPDYVAVAFDPRGKTFRHEAFSGYKAGRDAQPEDLRSQIPLVRELIGTLRIPLVEVPGYEADDVIATLVARAPEDVDVTIVSTDKDLMQLVSDRVRLVDGIKDRRYGPAEVEERFGVPPEKILDLRALVGDSSDNIPGVKGIGEKGGAKLIGEWGTLENLLEHVDEIKAKRAHNALKEHADEARLSKQLATLVRDVDLGCSFDELTRVEPDPAALRALYERLGFVRLLEALDAETGGEGRAARLDAANSQTEVEIVSEAAALTAVASRLEAVTPLSLLPIATPASAVDAELVGLAVAVGDANALYLPVGAEGLAIDRLCEDLLAPLLRSGRPWISVDAKKLLSLLREQGFDPGPASFDAGVAGFLIDSAGNQDTSVLARQYLSRTIATWEDLAGRGAKEVRAAQLPVADLASWAASQVCALRALETPMRERLAKDGLQALFEEIEMPLTGVLSTVERNGVRIDEERLARLGEEYARELERIEDQIFTLAGEKFLVNSPKQLQVILFEKLGLTPIKKTKTGYSTAEDVLEQLAAHHELPGLVLAWRRLSKLKSTYIEAIPPLVSEKTGRVHPVFHQNGAATGRMSASQPNVQNIPIRTEEGIRIREAFVPAEGSLLLSADYSQVELRILAHYSGDESLIEAFSRGEDIHRRTAAEVAGVDPDAVDAEMRARAKAINFGIIYGSSAFGIANQLGIASAEAQATIDAYFDLYQGVRRFIDTTIEEAREQGFVTTLFGRRRYLPDLASRNRVLRQAAERMAVNSVIQGTAADLIKRAMVAVDSGLAAQSIPARMILQVHDELVFEVPEAHREALRELVEHCMEGVCELRVPLLVEVGVGSNWREAH